MAERFEAAARELANNANMTIKEAKLKMADMIEAFSEKDFEIPDIPKDVVTTDSMWFDHHTDQGYSVMCSCGQKKAHPRGKVLVKWTKRHTEKTGHIWRGQNGARTIEDFERIVG